MFVLVNFDFVIDSDRNDGRMSRDSWELAESTTITSIEPREVGGR